MISLSGLTERATCILFCCPTSALMSVHSHTQCTYTHAYTQVYFTNTVPIDTLSKKMKSKLDRPKKNVLRYSLPSLIHKVHHHSLPHIPNYSPESPFSLYTRQTVYCSRVLFCYIHPLKNSAPTFYQLSREPDTSLSVSDTTCVST